MFNLDWHVYFLRECRLISTRSKDPSTKCGATIVRPDKFIISKGYNGFPKGMDDRPELYEDREYKYKFVMHAEENAILSARGADLTGCVLYTYPIPPCCRCVRWVLQTGISWVIAPDAGDTAVWERHSIRESLQTLVQCGINVRLIHPGKIKNDRLTLAN